VRAAERDTLLFFLAITSGSADGWSYTGLGHAFVANMTGNTVLLGIAVFSEHGDTRYPLIALAFYALGVAVASFLTRTVSPGSIWSKYVSGTLFLEALLLAFAGAGWISVKGTPGRLTSCVLLGCIATGIGLQSGALLPLRLPGIITTYITGTWTTLVSGLVLIGAGQERVRPNRVNFEERLLLQIGFLAVYFAAAVVTGWASRYMPQPIGGISSVPVLIVAIYGALRG
jgi:uncharacterized membrane protein YoaK (UPF0700 family)